MGAIRVLGQKYRAAATDRKPAACTCQALVCAAGLIDMDALATIDWQLIQDHWPDLLACGPPHVSEAP
jgi:hypothetical protein